MKTGSFKLVVLSALVVALSHVSGFSQTRFSAWDVRSVTEGNHHVESGLGIGNDFTVVKPVTVSSLGVFDSKGDGIQGSAVIKVHLYASNPDRARKRASGVLLETVLFDAADPGRLSGNFRYKPLLHPVTLLPGQYTITVEGFDEQNPDFRKTDPAPGAGAANRAAASPVILNDGGGLIRFTGCNHFHIGYFLQRTRTAKDLETAEHAPDRYAAATFIYSPAREYDSPFAADFTALTDGAKTFSWETNKSEQHSYRYSSVAVLDENAFPVIVEPSGSRLVFEAAAYHNVSGGRCVVFSDDQWTRAHNGQRSTLFANAVRWASRKSNPANVVVGVCTNVSIAPLVRGSYQLRTMDIRDASAADALAGCDVLAVDFQYPCSDAFLERVAEFVANGGGLVVTFAPRRDYTGRLAPTFERINALLKPFGLAYRSSLTQLNDLNVTNVSSTAYAPMLFNAFPAAELLRKNRLGQVQLDSLQRAIALNTISSAADNRPDLLSALSAAFSGSSNNIAGGAGSLGSFADMLVFPGAQANANRLGRWQPDGNSIVPNDPRGSLEYDFTTTSANLYRIQVFGVEDLPANAAADYDLLLSVDGIPLGQHSFHLPQGSGTLLAMFAAKLGQYTVAYGTNDHVECLTPVLEPGAHKLRIFWNNSNVRARLRLQNVHIQLPVGADRDGDGVSDWVKDLLESQSRLDATNELVDSYVSPWCGEGQDPFPQLMQAQVIGAEKNAPDLTPRPAPNGRWYLNVPLTPASETTLHVSYQNGARSEVRHIRWLPINVLKGGTYTIRAGDSLLLSARPEPGPIDESGSAQFTIGTNQFTLNSLAQQAWTFAGGGTNVVTATYTSSNGVPITGTITVQVVPVSLPQFKSNPAAHVGEERNWIVSLPPGSSLETDDRLSLGQLLPGETQTSLVIDQSEPRYFLYRLGNHGPVLDSGVAQGFDFWSGRETYLRSLKTFPDGSQLVEMLLILNPVLPDVTVQLDVLIGGVVFDDGTTTRRLTRADFDALGQCTVRFIHPPTFKASVCHSIKLLQGDTVIGQVW